MNREYREGMEKVSYMDDAYAIVQHHDAIAGTETQHVAEDYTFRLSIGQNHVQQLISEVSIIPILFIIFISNLIIVCDIR